MAVLRNDENAASKRAAFSLRIMMAPFHTMLVDFFLAILTC
jgi:hypothetical protein